MNIDFNAAFEGGMTKEDIQEMMERQLAMAEQEYNEKKAAELAKQEEAKARKAQTATKERLKAEARAYIINAFVAYTEAFDLLDEGETWDEEDITRLEQGLIKLEEMIPLYYKLFQLQQDFNGDFDLDGDLGLGGFFKG